MVNCFNHKMDTARLKIKFTPVMKEVCKNNSHCCLEIIPEISTIQNMNQLEWKEENNSIEYTVPMTYKIILKKIPRLIIKETINISNKMYYSCVDLLISSSLTTFNLACGDLNQIYSNNYITQELANLTNADDVQNLKLNHNEQKKKQECIINRDSIDDHIFKEQINDPMSNKDETREDIEKNNDKANEDTSSMNTVNTKRKSIDKITNTKSDFALRTDASTQSGETITCISTVINSISKGNSNRRLSQTPVCSIDTDIIHETVSHNSNIYHINELDKDFKYIANVCTFHGVYNNRNTIYKLFSKQHNIDPIGIKYSKIIQKKRILPEVRVAELVQAMEKEIIPLKLMLNEILCKCATLGTVWKKNSQISAMYKTINSNYNERVAQCCKSYIKSNRVVYSIVFDG